MKRKTTIKALKETNKNLVFAGYSDLQTLLKYHSPNAYHAGVYGWNFDVYELGGLTLCTGYRAMPGREANNVNDYERRAKEICNDYANSYDEKREKLENLLKEFCAQA